MNLELEILNEECELIISTINLNFPHLQNHIFQQFSQALLSESMGIDFLEQLLVKMKQDFITKITKKTLNHEVSDDYIKHKINSLVANNDSRFNYKYNLMSVLEEVNNLVYDDINNLIEVGYRGKELIDEFNRIHSKVNEKLKRNVNTNQLHHQKYNLL